MKPTVMHWDINARDAVELQQFYREVFDWDLRQTGWQNQYAYLVPDAQGIGGGIGQLPKEGEEGYGERHTGVTFFVKVDDLAHYLSRVVELGGNVVWGPMTFHEGLSLAMFEDPEGNRIGLMSN